LYALTQSGEFLLVHDITDDSKIANESANY
jgi:hypothetical protein